MEQVRIYGWAQDKLNEVFDLELDERREQLTKPAEIENRTQRRELKLRKRETTL